MPFCIPTVLLASDAHEELIGADYVRIFTYCPCRWGYEDTTFALTDSGQITLKGDKYPFSGLVFPDFRPWIEKTLGIDPSDGTTRDPPAMVAPPPVRNEEFVGGMTAAGVAHVSFSGEERIFHGHGHTCQEVFAVRFGMLKRIPDCVVWPTSHKVRLRFSMQR